ncbi:IclR family transcriptional regulator [Paramicrobacterium chengjingii]|uniref:Helix-turn-helix domain-containing protein n=1 Tax=Paramicrobacterium chengjingii TaxID=2769067 RepID=A0ABX6YJL1_9MICO|nr:IclR family transcriptional regulator C-terminal domain-containing protein [Microbacterium chengjingii]QPZ38993.1 helix-turn-helix domain-containing protein [Microbacterium chengjingii]
MTEKKVYRRPTYAITSVDHALRLIQIIRDTGDLRVSDAAAELGIATSTAHRLLAMLVYRGFAVQDDTRAYAPGPALGVAPSKAPWTRVLRDLLYPHVELLADRLNETVSLMFRVGGKVRLLTSVEAANVLRVGDRTGVVLNARDASGGKALLAEVDRASVERLYRSRSAELAGEYLADREFARILRELDDVRTRGFALNNEETEPGVCAIGASLRDVRGRPVAAFSVAVPATRRGLLRESKVIAFVREARSDMEVELRTNDFDATIR